MAQAASLHKFRLPIRACPAAAASNRDARNTRLLFFALCWYLLSQAFMIPVWAVGSLWPLWPTLADIGVVLFVTGLIVDSRCGTIGDEAKSLRHLLLMIVLGCGASYLLITILFAHYDLRISTNDRGQLFGGFFLFRMAQFAVVFWGTTRIAFTPERMRLLRILVTLALVAACAPVILTYFAIVPCRTFVSHLSVDLKGAGFWALYWLAEKRGVGTIGYNHAYTAVQILMLLALRMHLAPRSSAITEAVLILLALIAVFMSASRTGLAVAAMFSVIMASKKPQLAVVAMGIVLCGAFMMLDSLSASVSDEFSLTAERQSTILEANDTENLSGRDQIWQTYCEFLEQNPICILTGGGFGSSFELSCGAHMLFLTIITETGLGGLLLFLGFFLKILSLLRRREGGSQAIFWVTICLLVSCLTQETFYPVTALGHFLGFYLCGVALAIRNRRSLLMPFRVPSMAPLPARA